MCVYAHDTQDIMSATATRKRPRARSQGAAPEEGLGLPPEDTVIMGAEKEDNLFRDAPEGAGEAVDPATLQKRRQDLEAIAEEFEMIAAEEDEAHARQHNEMRARGLMAMMNCRPPQPEEDCNLT